MGPLTQWLISDWRTLLPSPFLQIGLILAALASGIIIGTEREKREKPAGLRTLALVCMGSAAFTMVGYAFAGTNGDSGRVAAQIVTGIGFLGAGVILHPRGAVSGATTAASIWVTASVGMIAGAGYPGASLAMSLLVRFVLAGIAAYEIRAFGNRTPTIVLMEYDAADGRTRVRMERILVDYPAASVETDWKTAGNGPDQLILRAHLQRHHLQELLDDLVSIPEVKSVRQQPPGQ